MTKKIVKSIFSILMIIWFVWLCSAKFGWQWWTSLNPDSPYRPGDNPHDTECEEGTDLWNCTQVKKDNSIIIRLLNVFGLDDSADRDLKFIDYARAIINMALWLVALIALIMSIYTFYLMFFTENEAWIKKAKWNLIGIFIALGIIWLAWLIVSFIFWWYQSNWKDKEQYIQTTTQWGTAMIINKATENQIYLTI